MQSHDDDKTVVGGAALDFIYSVISATEKQYIIEDGSEIVVGRGTDSDILIDDKKMSRKHAHFTIKDGRLQVTDLDSSNGTFVNGKRLSGATHLSNGDTVSFEKNMFSVKIEIKEEEKIEEVVEEVVEEDSDHTSIIDLSEDYFEKLNKAAENSEPPPELEKAKVVESEPPAKPKVEEPKPEKQAVKKEVKAEVNKAEAKAVEEKDIPSSWIEEASPVDGTRMMDVGELNKLRESAKIVSSNESSVSRLHCFIDGADEEIIELAIVDFSQASGWEIGRDEQCDIVINHPSVSNRHAQIVHQNGRWKMVNLVSTNGIMINGQKKLTSYLSDGDKIGLGQVNLVFKAAKNSKKQVKRSVKPIKQSGSNFPVIPVLLGLILVVLAVLIYFYMQ